MKRIIKILTFLLITSTTLCLAMEAYSPFIETIQMYSADGRTIEIPISEKEAYEAVNWYTEPVTLMYAADGRTLYIINSEVEAHQKVGWYLTEKEAKESIINQNELLLLAKTIHAEAASDNYTDKCYVGAVVMNRVASGIWGDSIYSVITAKGQYSSYGNKKFNQYPPEDCLEIAKNLLMGERYGVPYNVIFQSGSRQGTGIWKIVYNTSGSNHYYCYGNV